MGITWCCAKAKESQIVDYDPATNEFILNLSYFNVVNEVINYCPFCGTRLAELLF